jgi:hypothetical protein
VSPGEQADQHLLYNIRLTNDDLSNTGPDLLELGDSLPDFFPQATAVSHIVQDFSPKAPAAGFMRSAHTSRY